MKKLYFKKIFSITLYSLICLAIYFIGFSIISLIANFFKNPIIKLIILLGIPLTIILIRIYNKRLENPEMRREYFAAVNQGRFALKEEWRYMIKFPHFLAEILAFSTLAFLFAFVTIIGIAVSFTVKLLSMLTVFIISAGLYFVIDFGLWMLVHRTWKKEY